MTGEMLGVGEMPVDSLTSKENESTRFKTDIRTDFGEAEVFSSMVGTLMRARGWSEEIAGGFVTAIDDALKNAIEHGNMGLKRLPVGQEEVYNGERDRLAKVKEVIDKEIHIEFDLNNEEAMIAITDQGKGFKPEDLPNPTDKEGLMRLDGRGVYMMLTEGHAKYSNKGKTVEIYMDRNQPLPQKREE